MYGTVGCKGGNEFTMVHRPGADLDYGFVWTDDLAVGETIATSVWAPVVATTEITLTREQIAGSTTSAYVAGGVDGTDYVIKNTVVTAAPFSRTMVGILTLRCRLSC
jgi:hypothetical protein